MSQLYQANVEFKRIQTFLFSIPKLKEMLGANALLGEALRVTLPKLAEKHQTGLTMPDAKEVKSYQQARDDDPLENSDFPDNPIKDWEKGIVARDGGHFIAVFPTEQDAQAFKEEARNTLRSDLPGLRFDITISTFPKGEVVSDGTTTDDIRETFPEHLAIFEPCSAAPNAIASDIDRTPDGKVFISGKAMRFRDSGKDFKDGETTELINILNNASQLGGRKWKFAEDFNGDDGLAGCDQLAIIHADGNGIGVGFKDWMNNNKQFKGTESEELYNQLYFHKMRVAVRVALNKAITETFGHISDKTTTAPFQIMMLGGDDLLFVCQASYALDFVTEYAKALEADGVSIGAGVAIIPPSFPFYRGHALAEELAGSAKKKVRAINKKREEEKQKKIEVSVVDWMHITQAWSLDPEEARQKDSYVRYQVAHDTVELALSCRPYTTKDLEALLTRAKALEKEVCKGNIARSALRDMVFHLPRGKRQAEVFYDEKLKTKLNKLWKDLCNTDVSEDENSKNLWKDVSDKNIGHRHQYTTDFADLVEIVELLIKQKIPCPQLDNQAKTQEQS